MNYWQHRISHQWEVSYPLFDMGYLSIGWRQYISNDLLALVDDENKFLAEMGEVGRSWRCLLRFLRFQKGDIVVVPLFDKEFAIVRILGHPMPVSQSPLCGTEFNSRLGESVVVTSEGIILKDTGKCFDIGFIVKFELLRRLPRSFADSALVSRMKYRQTNCEIGDLEKSISQALQANGPISIHDSICEKAVEKVLEALQEKLDDRAFERTIKWYMLHMGADRVYIPAKNDPKKREGADADIVAEFDDLGLVYYIQAKKHDQFTNSWAIEQIERYRQQMQTEGSNITYIAWVVSTGYFDDDMLERAKNVNVRLIGGLEFSQMLLHCGIHDIDSVVKE